ncbi:MAG TPA: hypothetical protein VIE90_15115 [Candidatus Binatia bacterium]
MEGGCFISAVLLTTVISTATKPRTAGRKKRFINLPPDISVKMRCASEYQRSVVPMIHRLVYAPDSAARYCEPCNDLIPDRDGMIALCLRRKSKSHADNNPSAAIAMIKPAIINSFHQVAVSLLSKSKAIRVFF